MVDVAISALPASGALTGAELIPEVQGGTTKRTTTSAIAALRLPAGATTEVQINLAGVLAASPRFKFDPTTGQITLSDGANSATIGQAGALTQILSGGTLALRGTTYGKLEVTAGDLDLLASGSVSSNAEIKITTAGKGLSIKGGSNARIGTVNLVGGIATINTTALTANSRIFLTVQQQAGITNGNAHVDSINVGAGQFDIVSDIPAADASLVAWMIVEEIP